MKFLYLGTSGSENPTRAALPFFMAKGARDAGHDVEVILAGDAVVLFHPAVAKNVVPVGFPPLEELMAFARTNGIPVYG
jgi:predicted peroxiredoxin